MDAIVLTWRELLIAIVLATLVYLLEVALFSRRRRAKGQAEASGHEDEVSSELARLSEELADLRIRLERLEARLASAASDKMAEDTPYGRAVRLAREGLSAQELASRCGISRGEAELIIALNRTES
jgi:hypothetical protein